MEWVATIVTDIFQNNIYYGTTSKLLCDIEKSHIIRKANFKFVPVLRTANLPTRNHRHFWVISLQFSAKHWPLLHRHQDENLCWPPSTKRTKNDRKYPIRNQRKIAPKFHTLHWNLSMFNLTKSTFSWSFIEHICHRFHILAIRADEMQNGLTVRI